MANPTNPSSPSDKKRFFRLTPKKTEAHPTSPTKKAEANPASPKLVPGHARTQSEGKLRPKPFQMSSEAGPIQSASADNVALVGRTVKSPGMQHLSPLPVSPDDKLFRRNAQMDIRSPKSPKSPRINLAPNNTDLPASPISAASNSSNSSAASHGTFEARTLQAADSLFWLTRNSPKDGYLRVSDLRTLGRNLAPTQKDGQTKEQLKERCEYHTACLSAWVEVARGSNTGKLLEECFNAVETSQGGTNRYFVQNDANAVGSGRTSAQLTEEAEEIISRIESTFEQDALSQPAQHALQRCDELLVDWFQESRAYLDNPDQKPGFALLDIARHNMLSNALVVYGLSKLKAASSDPVVLKIRTALAAAVMARLIKGNRIEVLLRESEKRMPPAQQALVQMGHSWQVIGDEKHPHHARYLALKAGLETQGTSRERCGAAWCWLNRAEKVLKIPEFLQPYFEQAALNSGKFASSAAHLENIEPDTLKRWAASAIRAAVAANAPETDSEAVLAQILKMQETLESLKEDELRQQMKGFE